MRCRARTAVIAIILAALAVVVVGGLFPFWRPILWRSQGIAALSAANDEQSLRQAVGRYGVFIPRKDGSWIAIRYMDSHGGGIWSLAIARDSGGRWFESRHHFCGEFGFFDRWVRAQALPADSLERLDAASYIFDDDHGDLRNIYNASTLDEAREALVGAGFVAMD